jgi:hypothetical protein
VNAAWRCSSSRCSRRTPRRVRSMTVGDSSRRTQARGALAQLEQRLAPADGPTFGFVHVQTDDVEKVKRDAAKVLRFEPDVEVEGNWVRVRSDATDAEPERLKALAKELSYTTGGVVLSLGVDRGVVRSLRPLRQGRRRRRVPVRPRVLRTAPSRRHLCARRERDRGRPADWRRPEARARGGAHRGLARRAATRPGAVRTDRNR